MMKINKKLIKELVNCLEENKLSELEYSEKDIKIKVARSSSNQGNNIQVLYLILVIFLNTAP